MKTQIIPTMTALFIIGNTMPISAVEASAFEVPMTSTAYSYSSSIRAQKVKVKKSYSSGTRAIKIKWNKVVGATGYRIYKYDNATKKWKDIKNVKTESYKDVSLKPGTIYKYHVKAFSRKNGKTYWSKRSATKTVSTKPAAAKVSASDILSTSATLNWNKVNCDGYVIMKADKNGNYNKVKTIKGKNNTSITFNNLKANTSYVYGIKPYKSDKNGKNNYGKLTSVSFKTAKKSYSKLDMAYIHFMEATITEDEMELIRQDLCDYAVKKWNGKTEVVSSNKDCGYEYTTPTTTTITFTEPMKVEREPELRTEFREGEGTVEGDAHQNVYLSYYDWDSSDYELKLFKNRAREMMDTGMIKFCLESPDTKLLPSPNSDDMIYSSYLVDASEYQKYPMGIDVGFSWESNAAYYNGTYHKVYWLWFLNGEVGTVHEPTNEDEILYG